MYLFLFLCIYGGLSGTRVYISFLWILILGKLPDVITRMKMIENH